MKLSYAILGTLTLMASTASFAGTISSSPNLEFLVINGQKASKSLLKGTTSFNAPDKETQQVVVRLSEIIGSGSNQSLFESNPIVVTFESSGDDIEISAPKIRNHNSGDKFNKMPVIMVKTKAGEDIPAKVDVLKQEGLFPSANVINDLTEYNSSSNPAAVTSFASTDISSTAKILNQKATKTKVIVQGKNIAEQQLQYWFQQADKATQARFLNWASKYNSK